ncbi:ParA family protein [Rohdeia mirabilis]|uniref:ParA family protein n=1 Tax=Rohdeia mirabilis TaxID=2528008 RepID=UPI003AF38983
MEHLHETESSTGAASSSERAGSNSPLRGGGPVWTFANQKGGCGKTTTAVHLAGALAAAGEQVLLIDMDPQAHATMALGRASSPGSSIGDVLMGERRLDDVLQQVSEQVWLAPAAGDLARFERAASERPDPERALRRALGTMQTPFDWVLVDCPPRADGILTANAVVASTTVLLVVETGAFSLQGALKARGLLEDMADALEVPLEMRVVATIFDRELEFAREVLVAMQARFGELLFDTTVRSDRRLREAAGYGAFVQDLAPESEACDDFRALAEEARAHVRRTSAARS